MGQVPSPLKGQANFLIVGSGRLARHLAHYFTLEQIAFSQWSRSTLSSFSIQTAAGRPSAGGLTYVLLAISDQAIEPFCRENADVLQTCQVVHFSGALVTPLAIGAHPLMTFSNELYPRQTYRQIAFVCEKPLTELLPGLKNPAYLIAAADKALYHAWCVMSGNFTTLLWETFAQRLETRFKISSRALLPYLSQVRSNLHAAVAQGSGSVLTGPLARGDLQTIEKNVDALRADDDLYAEVYEAFVETFLAGKFSPVESTL